MPAEAPAGGAGAAPAQGSVVRRFGVRVAGTPLLLPEMPLEHVADATVFPLPGAGSRVRGMMQLRGHPVVVLDAAPAAGPEADPDGGARPAVLVFGSAPDAAGLVVSGPPRPLQVGTIPVDAPRPAADFADVLGDALAEAQDPSSVWWSFEPRRLFEWLAAR